MTLHQLPPAPARPMTTDERLDLIEARIDAVIDAVREVLAEVVALRDRMEDR